MQDTQDSSLNHGMLKAESSAKQRHPDYIALQRVIHDLSTFQLLKLYVNVMIIFATTKFIVNLIAYNTTDKTTRQLIDVIIEFFQIFGYAYGLQAHTTKGKSQAWVFQIYLIFAFFFIGYYAYSNFVDKEWLDFGIEVFHFNFNIMLFMIVRRFIGLINRRDQLKLSLQQQGQV